MNIMNFATRDVVTVAPRDSIDRAISLMEERGIHHLIVTVENRPVGIVSDRDILISTGWMLAVERRTAEPCGARKLEPRRVEQIMSRPVLRLTTASSAKDAAELLTFHKISATPIVFDEQLVGIVTDTDLLRWLDTLAIEGSAVEQFLKRKVQGRMRSPARTVAPDTPLGEVVDVFRRFHVRHVPVTLHSKLLGIISDRDVRRALGWSSVHDLQAEASGHLSSAAPPNTAADIMHHDVATTTSSALLRDTVRQMLDLRIHSLPVVDAAKLVGIITHTDFIKAIAREDLL